MSLSARNRSFAGVLIFLDNQRHCQLAKAASNTLSPSKKFRLRMNEHITGAFWTYHFRESFEGKKAGVYLFGNLFT
jgi:hypothetical protein